MSSTGESLKERVGKAITKMRSRAANPATFTLTAIQPVTGVGAPS